MSKANTDHAYYDQGDSEIRCRHCGDSSAIADGTTVELAINRFRGFLLMHKLCRPAPLPDRQMSLPGTEADPPRNPEAEAQGKALAGKVALCWTDLWPQLKLVLSDQDYQALAAYTPFAERLHQEDFNAIAAWAARELSEEPGVLEPCPAPLTSWLERALSYSQVERVEEPPKKKRRSRRKPEPQLEVEE